ncbi:hypothetical protein PTSG_08328 [Salpingoeca rosetta]|uniref:Uncharacterized protein n=1 Tax=Salpingoeca rosetta (strain ATCC 50818 / BSB-021) TaxID=946362 RepID=F2UJD6_SALR5|nr:uncharacterized protein PTSG_08328 [Salpingoeca rosetta]EGD77235.1 hypothetical protein PTSG_08328 [Salpingoeca rosetta]|eukprot:XP_004990579.1 hypothetical protein PTSG_08328 [Salpingoeca rosetta]
MSLFGFLSKKPAEAPADRNDVMAKALHGIDEQIQMLTKKEEVLQRRVLECTKKAKAARKKEQAMPHLRHRKRVMKQIGLVNGQIDNLTNQRFALENATTVAESVKQMKAGNEALKKQGLDIDRMQDEMDDIADEMQKLDEVSDLMSQPLFGEQFDDDELFAEFEAETLEDEELGEDVELPDVPESEIQAPAAKEEEKEPAKAKATEQAELEDLAAW